jgi:murein DD-endopeptidase MepM/ murein hydrolase activator NlpD
VRHGLILGLLAALASGGGGAAGAMNAPRLQSADVDWAAVATALADGHASPPMALRPPRAGEMRSPSIVLDRLNAVMSQRFPGVGISPVPVLLPFDAAALLRDLDSGTAAEDNDRYLSGFHASTFFHPGLAGYHAAFAVHTRDVPEFAHITFADPIQVQISGSALLYELDPPIVANGAPVPALEPEFSGIRRTILEHHLRYTFVRYGVPYVVSVVCFDASVSRFRIPTCRVADQVALRFLRALRVVGGTPQVRPPAAALAIERPGEPSRTFSYHAPGRLLPGTTFRGHGGRADRTVYSQIRFPLGKVPAYVNSQKFQSRNKGPAADPDAPPNYSYPWRDSFCEIRGFVVGQCPGGIGHQGQDIRPALCKPAPGAARCDPSDEVVAVRDGVIMRNPRQEAVYVIVNTATEHVRFRYLHMNPHRMDEDGLFSGRRVQEGEVIGRVSNFHKREGGTSYHLHFDIQVPTKDGWVFVNPYMTLISAYERLIGERGEEIVEPSQVASADPSSAAALATASPAARPAVTKRHTVKRSAHKKFRSARHARAGKGRFKFKRHYPDLARY